MTTKPITIKNDLGERFTIAPHHRPICAQCLNPMTLETYTWSSQQVSQTTWTCYHKLTTRMKRRVFVFNKKGQVSQWK